MSHFWTGSMIAALVLLAGCNGSQNTTGNSSANTGNKTSTASSEGKVDKKTDPKDELPPVKPLLEGWEKPAVAFILSSEENGYLEPCGCSETQSGGMARRADLFAQLEAKNWPLVPLANGNYLKRARQQSRLKYDAILDSLATLNYFATGIGPADLDLGFEKLLERGTLNQTASEEGEAANTFLSSNVILYDPGIGVPDRTKSFEMNGVKIGVTSVIGETVQSQMLKSSSQDVKILPVAESLPKAVEELKAAGNDINILLSFSEPEESQKLLEQFPIFNVVLTAKGPEDPDPRAIPVGENGQLMLKVGQKGKHVGVLGYYPDSPDQKFKWELVNLDNRRFKNDPRMREHMANYQQNLVFENFAKNEPAITHTSGNTFVGAKSCKKCHTKAYAKWKDSKHAHAFETLISGRKGQEKEWVPRTHDPECLACHVTGWEPQDVLRFNSGFVSEKETPDLKGQQCENCHGPASQHVDLELQWEKDRKSVQNSLLMESRKNMHINKPDAEKVCAKCHDHENSPKFDFEKYWKQIEHPFRD